MGKGLRTRYRSVSSISISSARPRLIDMIASSSRRETKRHPSFLKPLAPVDEKSTRATPEPGGRVTKGPEAFELDELCQFSMFDINIHARKGAPL